MKVGIDMFFPLYCETNGSYFPSLIPAFNVNVIRATAGRILTPVSHNVSQSIFIVFLKTTTKTPAIYILNQFGVEV